MKKNVLYLLLFLAGTVGFAQETPGNEITSVMNMDYITAVQQKSESNTLKKLQQAVSGWDVRRETEFDRRQDLFTVVFRSDAGKIVAKFDKNGEIFSTDETYKNVVLPKSIGARVMKLYPGWQVVKSKQIIQYERNKTPLTSYKIRIASEEGTKTIRLTQN